MEIESQIRNTVRAVIIRHHQILLLLKEDDERGKRYGLPGGAQEPGETLQQALERECLEEINTEVTVGDMIHIADFFKDKTTPKPHIRHQLEILFYCSVPEHYQPQNGSHPDRHQIGVDWVNLNELKNLTLSPLFFSEFLAHIEQRENDVYLGTIK